MARGFYKAKEKGNVHRNPNHPWLSKPSTTLAITSRSCSKTWKVGSVAVCKLKPRTSQYFESNHTVTGLSKLREVDTPNQYKKISTFARETSPQASSIPPV